MIVSGINAKGLSINASSSSSSSSSKSRDTIKVQNSSYSLKAERAKLKLLDDKVDGKLRNDSRNVKPSMSKMETSFNEMKMNDESDDDERFREQKEEKSGGRVVSRDSSKQPTKMTRAKYWDDDVEENYRFQAAGWRDLHEYLEKYGEPQRWEENGYVKCLRVKKNGFYTYWRDHRECDEKHVGKVKIYEY